MGGGLSKDHAQECEGGNAIHGSSVDKAGTSTSARRLGGGACRGTLLGASSAGTLSGRERCGVDRRGGGGWGGRALLASEVGALQKWMSTLSSLDGCWYTYRNDGTESTRLIKGDTSVLCLSSRPRGGTYRRVLVHVECRDWLARRGKVALRSEGRWLGVEQEYVTMGSSVLRG
jgi:hypothetical protein